MGLAPFLEEQCVVTNIKPDKISTESAVENTREKVIHTDAVCYQQ